MFLHGAAPARQLLSLGSGRRRLDSEAGAKVPGFCKMTWWVPCGPGNNQNPVFIRCVLYAGFLDVRGTRVLGEDAESSSPDPRLKCNQSCQGG